VNLRRRLFGRMDQEHVVKEMFHEECPHLGRGPGYERAQMFLPAKRMKARHGDMPANGHRLTGLLPVAPPRQRMYARVRYCFKNAKPS
jgi:hypothetical protein